VIPSLSYERLVGTPEDLATVRSLLDRAPRYAVAVHGGPFGPGEAESVFRDLPPRASSDAKRVYVVRSDGVDVGILECLVGYPGPETLMVGLLLFDERWQGLGYGRRSIEWLERRALEHEGVTRIRLGVVARNTGALGFWASMGYVETGEVKPWSEGTVESEVVVFEKALVSEA